MRSIIDFADIDLIPYNVFLSASTTFPIDPLLTPNLTLLKTKTSQIIDLQGFNFKK